MNSHDDLTAGPSGGHPADEVLLDFSEGRLRGSDEQSVRAHIESCGECREAVALASRARELATSEAVEAMPPERAAAMHGALASEWDKRTPVGAARRAGGWRRMVPALIAASLVSALVGLAVNTGGDDATVSTDSPSAGNKVEEERGREANDLSAPATGGDESGAPAEDSAAPPTNRSAEPTEAAPQAPSAATREGDSPAHTDAEPGGSSNYGRTDCSVRVIPPAHIVARDVNVVLVPLGPIGVLMIACPSVVETAPPPAQPLDPR